MEGATFASQICRQFEQVFSAPTGQRPSAYQVLVDELTTLAKNKGRVFLFSVGREGLMLKALAMRLYHLGLSAHCVFDMNTPPCGPSDLLIVSAGPGGHSTINAIMARAKSDGARVLLLTAQPETGSAVQHSSAVAYVPAQTMANDQKAADDAGAGEPAPARAMLPMGSVYEGALFILSEMVVYKLGQVLNQSPEEIRKRHTNLE